MPAELCSASSPSSSSSSSSSASASAADADVASMYRPPTLNREGSAPLPAPSVVPASSISSAGGSYLDSMTATASQLYASVMSMVPDASPAGLWEAPANAEELEKWE